MSAALSIAALAIPAGGIAAAALIVREIWAYRVKIVAALKMEGRSL